MGNSRQVDPLVQHLLHTILNICIEVWLPLLGYKVTSGFRCVYVLRGSIERKIISEINKIISLIK